MRRPILIFSVTVIVLSSLIAPHALLSQNKPPSPPSWSVYFSPNGGCTEAIVKELDKAKTSVLVQAYSFTSAPIAKALVTAHERGVNVEIILDKSNLTAQYTSGPFVAKAGIPTKITRRMILLTTRSL